MASVSSLDKDLSRLRSAKYSAKDSDEIKQWFSEILQTPLPEGKDLMDCLKDGVVLCRLINQLPGAPTLKPKASNMPFVQMEQIAAFINVISKPPISLPAHDLFLTVDLFEKKDPAQVVQCLTSFSRIANAISPQNFPSIIGGVKAALSPSLGGGSASGGRRDFNSSSSGVSGVSGYSSNSATTSSSLAPTVVQPMFPPTSPAPAVGFQSAYKKPPQPVVPSKSTNVAVSSWSSKDDEKKSIPAWNIHQYGYMGGASQGNMGVSFGGRRQIVNTTPLTPKVKDESVRKVETAAMRELFGEREKAEALRRLKEEEEKSREEELRWKRLEEEEAKERETEMARKKLSLQEAEKRMTWQREQDIKREAEFAEQKRQRDAATQQKLDLEKAERERERARMRELERELELARHREAQYQAEKEKLRHEMRPEKQQSQKWGAGKLEDKSQQGTEPERRFLQHAWTENSKASPVLTPLKAHRTGGSGSPMLHTKKSAPNFSTITTHRTGGAPALIPQRTGGLVAQLTGEFNKMPSPSLKTLTPGEYPSSGRISPSLLTPQRTGERRALPPHPTTIRSHKTGGDFPKPSPPPRALPTPPIRKPDLPPREFSSPTKAPTFRNYTSRRTPSLASDFSTASTLRRQNSWEHDNETVIDVPTGRSDIQAVEEAEKAKAYRWANLSFLEKERERERERQKEWERNQLEKEMKASSGLGGYRSPLMGPRAHR